MEENRLENEELKPTKKKMSKKKKIILFSVFGGILTIILTISIVIIIISTTHKKIEFNNETIDISTDTVEINDETNNIINTTAPIEIDSKEAMKIAISLVSDSKEFEVTTTGNTVASISLLESNVVINNKRTIKNGEAMITCVSAGPISNASQRYFKGDKVYLRNSKNVSSDANVTFDNNEDLEVIDHTAYMNRYGWMPFQLNGYLISSETYLENPIMKDNGDNTYTCSFKLKPSEAAFYYQREIVTNSNASELEFTSISLDVTMDDKYKILSVKIVEEYKIVMSGIMAGLGKIPTTTTVVDKFNYDDVSFDSDYLNYFNNKINN